MKKRNFLTQCKQPGCGAITNSVYCDLHVPKDTRDNAYRRGYDQHWRKAREVFLLSHPICNHCGRLANVVDHIIPHKGNKKLFWDKSNWQPLCTECHNRKTASEDMGAWVVKREYPQVEFET